MDSPPFLAPGVSRLTVNLNDEDLDLFENLWPVPDGVALHAYLLQGDRAVVVDPWDAGGYGPEEVAADLEEMGMDWSRIAAVAFTKAPAPDLVARIRTFHPGLEDWGTPVTGARHELGAGMVLEARLGVWFVAPAGVALTGDAFAGLGWVDEELWTEDLDEHEARYFEDEALRWYSLRPTTTETLPEGTKIVAPAHGCAFQDPARALERSNRFAAWARGPALDEVTIVWPSGAEFEVGADALVGGALDVDAGVNLLRLPGDDPSALATGARRASLVVVAAGLDTGFLAGLEKPLWRPDPQTPVAELREGLVARWKTL